MIASIPVILALAGVSADTPSPPRVPVSAAAQVAIRRGDNAQAIAILDRDLAACERSQPDAYACIDLYDAIIAAAHRGGDYRTAYSYSERRVRSAERHHGRGTPAFARDLIRHADAQRMNGMRHEADTTLKRAQAIFLSATPFPADDYVAACHAYFSIGWSFGGPLDHQRSTESIHAAHACIGEMEARAQGKSLAFLKLLTSAAVTHQDRGYNGYPKFEFRDALRLLRQAIALEREIPDRELRAALLANIAELTIDAGDNPRDTEAMMIEAYRLKQELRDQDRMVAAGLMARYYRKRGFLEKERHYNRIYIDRAVRSRTEGRIDRDAYRQVLNGLRQYQRRGVTLNWQLAARSDRP